MECTIVSHVLQLHFSLTLASNLKQIPSHRMAMCMIAIDKDLSLCLCRVPIVQDLFHVLCLHWLSCGVSMILFAEY